MSESIANYQAAITPEAVKATLHAVKDCSYVGLIDAAGIRAGAALTLQDVLAAEIAR
jgi:hypothetical protein